MLDVVWLNPRGGQHINPSPPGTKSFLLPPLESPLFAHTRGTSKQNAHLTSIGSCTSLGASRTDAPSANRNPHWLPAMTWQGPICTTPAIERFTLFRVGPLHIRKQPGTGPASGLVTCYWKYGVTFFRFWSPEYSFWAFNTLRHCSPLDGVLCFNFSVQIGYGVLSIDLIIRPIVNGPPLAWLHTGITRLHSVHQRTIGRHAVFWMTPFRQLGQDFGSC